MKKILPRIKSQLAFTMIELLIVIAILGILAVAVLAAINPVEQINRGRDTGTRSDAEQLLSSIDRFYAYKGYYPWQTGPNDGRDAQDWMVIDALDGWVDADAGGCNVLDKLANGDGATCDGTNEVKRSFVTKILETDYNHLYVYGRGNSGDSVYVCFEPQSEGFMDEASTRCGTDGDGLPADIDDTAEDTICDAAGTGTYYICLP